MAGIKLNLKGFEKLLDEIQEAGGNLVKATEEAVTASAEVVESELRSACNNAGVPASITSEIHTTVEWNGNRCSAKVGWDMGSYDPKNPSAGYKAVFLNYGTPKRFVSKDKLHVNIRGRWVTESKDRGAIAPKHFISSAKDAATPKVKKIQKKTLNEILKGLKK